MKLGKIIYMLDHRIRIQKYPDRLDYYVPNLVKLTSVEVNVMSHIWFQDINFTMGVS